MMDLVKKQEASREEGQTMAEYAVVLGVITIGVVAVFGLLAGAVQGAVNTVIGYIYAGGPAAVSRGRAWSSS
jgi:Flp pilus assembly pilin Flp